MEKYPKYEIILRMYEEANGCECTFESLSKIRLQKFIDYMSGRVAKSSARQYAAKFKAVLNLYSEEFHIIVTLRDSIITLSDLMLFIPDFVTKLQVYRSNLKNNLLRACLNFPV